MPEPADQSGGGNSNASGSHRAAIIVVTVIVVVCLAAVGAGFALTSGTQPQSRAAETPRGFLTHLFSAIRTGDATFLLARLNKVATEASGMSACRTFVKRVHAPTEAFDVVSIGVPGPFAYVVSGRTFATVHSVLPVEINVTSGRASQRQTIHIARLPNGTYSWFGNCGSLPAKTPARSIAGTYVGTWSNTTFGSTGPITMHVHIGGTGKVGSPVAVTLTVGGMVFGGTAPAPETFSGAVTPSGITFTGTSAAFGLLTWHIAPSGALVAHGVQVPGGKVTTFNASGAFTPIGVSLSYHVGLVGGTTAAGTMQATKTG